MASRNKSINYLKEREWARAILSRKTPQWQYALDQIRTQDNVGNAAPIFDDDDLVDWTALVDDHKDDLMIATSCREAREAFNLQRQSHSNMGSVPGQPSKMLRFFSPPFAYVLRKITETGDPDYWNDQKNVLKEALDNPQWATVPAEYIRGHYERLLPKSRKDVVTENKRVSEKQNLIEGPWKLSDTE